jgi:hypothetical protein
VSLRDPAEEPPPPRPEGAGLWARVVAALCLALVPVFLILNQVSTAGVEAKGWDTYQRTDLIILVFAILGILVLAGSYASPNPALPAAAVGLAFAIFGLVLVFPVEQMAAADDAKLEIGGILTILAAFGAGVAALVAAASDGARARLR